MCNTRAFRYSCGHASYRHLSSCRGTYADPRGAVVLCNGSPDLTVTVAHLCTSCQYRDFRETWENRLADTQEKRSVAIQMLREFEDDGVTCAEVLSDSDSLANSADNELGDFFGDASVISQELQKADAELVGLKEQYEHEVMTKWNGFLQNEQQQKLSAKLRKLRRPAPKHPGSSPLKNEKTFAQIAMEAQAEDENSSRRPSMGMSRSPSLTSDSSEDSVDSVEDEELDEPPPSILPPHSWTLPNVSFEKSGMDMGFGPKLRTIETAIEDDNEDVMLPNYDF